MPSTLKPVDCSELAATITKIAFTLGADPKLNTIDKVLTEMQRTLPELSREQVVDSINEFMDAVATKRTSIESNITKLKKEARSADSAKRKKIAGQITKLEQQLAEPTVVPVKPEEVPGSKELERLQFQRDQLRKKINQRIRSLKPVGVWGRLAEPLNATRAIMTSFDFSAALRQGGFIVIAHPIRSAKAFPTLFRSLTKQGQARVEAEIASRSNAPLYARYKLFIAKVESGEGLVRQEEAVMSRLAERIPIVAASQRSYTTFLNKLRADSFDAMVETLAKNREVTAEEGLAITNFVNVATGRGNVGNFEQAAVVMNSTFFAPRYVLSRFQLLITQPLSIVTPQKFGGQPSLRLRKLIATEYARYLIGMGIIYALARAAGYDIEEDPRSSDFGKIKIGRTRMDPLSGISQATVFLSRVTTGKTKSTKTGRVTSIRDNVKFGRDDTADVIARFARSKLAPVPGAAVELVTGTDVIGNKVTPLGILGELVTPLALSEVIDIMQEEESVPVKTAEGLAVIFGVGAQVHKPRKK